jgi:tRNA uridine 5-carboxymethylaminomethyl modification enzyme
MKTYDVIVIGSGHAGIEASHAAAVMGCSVLLLIIDIDTIGKLSCNPAVGGVAKGHLVRETDALGGLIGRLADDCALGYRILNRSKGKAVWSTRAQVDKFLYPKKARSLLENTKNITILQAQVSNLLLKGRRITGVRTNFGQEFKAKSVVVCAGTFLKSTIHIGMMSFGGGRLNEPTSDELFKSIRKLGFATKHFKTGTCARLDKRTIDFSKIEEQAPDKDAIPFSLINTRIRDFGLSCFITHTNKKTHNIIRANLKYSPLYSGKIKAKGVRYCPSLEDKVVKFSDRDRHQIFVEPEGLDSYEIYPNGISTSLPFEVQVKFIRTIAGFQNAQIMRPGYGIEHGVIDAKDLYPTLEAKGVGGLYFAGQVNGTTGYEEAAAQGLVAGINAALLVKKKKPFILRRETSYIGVMIDDLTAKGTDEPYRMFTSRSEFRLSLRETNSDLRLVKSGRDLGLIDRKYYDATEAKKEKISKEIKKLEAFKIALNSNKITAHAYLRRPHVEIEDLKKYGYSLESSLQVRREVEIEIKYENFIQREKIWAKDLNSFNKIKLPVIDYTKVPSLSREIVEKLNKFKPNSLDEALKISGVTPAAIIALFHYIRKQKPSKSKA